MRVLVTRPLPDGQDTAARLTARGHAPLLAPLLEVSFLPDAELELTGAQALLVTSANGARALGSATDRRDLPVFAVGAASASAARALGFDNTVSADGDVAALAALVSETLSPRDGPLVHVAGSVTAGDLAGNLARAGFRVVRAVLYRADAVARLPVAIAEALDAGAVDAALFYSPRTAAQFVDLVTAAGLGGQCGGLTAVALSPAVAAKLSGLAFAAIRIADSPDQDSLLRALEGAGT